MEIAPGSILQRMHLKKRLMEFSPKNFCEIGSGNGYISNILLNQGLTGVGYDLNASACENNRLLNAEFITQKKLKLTSIISVFNTDFILPKNY